MVNVGPLTAEICWRVFGTPANFSRFREAAVSRTLWRGTRNGITKLSQRAPLIFGWAAITLGIGPHSGCQRNWYFLADFDVLEDNMREMLVFNEREGVLSPVRLSSVCNVHAPYSAG